MADLATLGLAVDSSQLTAADKALGNFAQSGKNAQIAADVLVASAVRLGISVEEVQRRLAASNDNMAAATKQAMMLSDATKQASASNDNFAKSMNSAGSSATDAGRGFLGTIEHVLNLTSHLKLLALGAYALFPAFRGVVNAGLSRVLLEIIPAASLAGRAIGGIVSVLSPAISFFARIGIPILAAVSAFEVLHAIWSKGVALLEQYAKSLRSLYSEDTVQNLQKLTRGQQDIISAEQVARATELGVRLEDAQFTISKMLQSSFDLTDPALKLQAIWVVINETVASILTTLVALPAAIDRAAKTFGNSPIWDKISGRKPGEIVDLSFPGESDNQQENNAASIQAATNRLSAMMGVAALAAEALKKTTKAAGELDKELEIGDSFIARYSDAIKKLTDGVKDTDSWDRVAKSIDRTTARLEANAASVGKTVQFHESLRVETQLLTATTGGLNAVTDEQQDKYIELRIKGIDPVNASIQAGIKLSPEYAAGLARMGKAAGDAASDFAKANFELANQKALESDEISRKALTAFSPAQKGEIAALQKQLELKKELRDGTASQEQVDERVASARKLATDTELQQLSEVARSRKLAAVQAIDSAAIELQLLGKTEGQQVEIKANPQARQQLEQEAYTKRTKFDEDQYAALQKINKGLGEQTQLIAAVKQASEAASTFASGFLKDLAAGQPAIKALENALHNLASSLIDAAIKPLVNKAIASITEAIGGAATGATGATASATILTTAGSTLAAQMVAGATQAAGILTGAGTTTGTTIATGGVTAGTEVTAGGATAGTEVATGGATAGSELAAGGAAAATAILGPLALLLAAVAAAAAAIGLGNKSAEEENRKQVLAASQERSLGYLARAQLAGIDTSTREGALQAQQIQFAEERRKDGGDGIFRNGALVAAQEAERLALIKQWDDKELAELNASNEAKAAAEKQALDESLKRQKSYQDRLFNATNDTSTLAGALAAFDRNSTQERIDEMAAGGQAINDLVAAQEAERLNIYKEFNNAAIEAAKQTADYVKGIAKSINDYLQGLKIGANSILNPQDRLAAAQSFFNSQIGLARTGDKDALSSITQTAQALLDQAKSFYASGAGYANVYNAVVSSLQNLGYARGGLIPGYASGGMISNGIFGVDSVLASFAGGGNIALAGGEYVMPAAQTRANLPKLEAMRSGASNDNTINSIGQQLVRAIAGVSSAEMNAWREGNEVTQALLQQLINAVRSNKPLTYRPGSETKAKAV